MGKPAGLSQEAFFQKKLREHIDQLAKQVGQDLTGIPIFLSGMASSSIGMAEVPYATLPFALDGTQASIRHLDATPDFPNDICLISGVRSGPDPQRRTGQTADVMRGEETQLIGVWSLLSGRGAFGQSSVFVFPGTHSKHLYINDNQLVHFETYMTGELFGVMTKHSILADSVDTDDLTTLSGDDATAFRRGVRQSIDMSVLAGLFTVRTNDLFSLFTKRQNSLYLSGLLIGSELGHLLTKTDWSIVLCSSPNLAEVYELAIDELGLSDRTTFVPPDLIDRAAPAGQLRLFQHEREKQLIG